MIRGMLLIFALSSCTAPSRTQAEMPVSNHVDALVPYQAFVRTGFGIPGSPPSNIAIVPDASVRVPPIIAACGAIDVAEEPLTDGGTSFHFDVVKSNESVVIACLRKQIPGLEALNGGGI